MFNFTDKRPFPWRAVWIGIAVLVVALISRMIIQFLINNPIILIVIAVVLGWWFFYARPIMLGPKKEG